MGEVLRLFIELAQHVALLLSLVFVWSLLAPRLEQAPPGVRGVVTGALFGIIALIGMLARIQVAPGVMVDGRGVVVALAGVFGGAVSALTAASLVGAYRLWLGGAGAVSGVGAIVTAMALGAWVHRRWGPRVREFQSGQFLLLGAALAGSGLLWTQAIPDAAVAWRMLTVQALPVSLLYPLATWLAGLLLCHVLEERERVTLTEHSVEHSSEVVLWIASTGRVARVNRAAVRLCGYSREEFLSLHLWNLDANFSRDAWPAAWNTVRDRTSVTCESSLRARDGRLIHVEISATYLEFEGAGYVCAFVRDISERKQAEDTLREGEERYRRIVETTNEVIYRVTTRATDPFGGTVEFVSSQVENILGYRPDEFLEDPGLWFRIVHPDDLPALAESTRKILAGREAGTRQYRLRHKKTAEYRWIEDTVAIQADGGGNVIALQGAARDITERKRAADEAERRRQEAEVLAEVGRLVSESLDPSEVAKQIVENLRTLTGCGASTLYRLEPETGELVSLAAASEAGAARGLGPALPRGTGVVGLAVVECRPVVTTNLLTDPRVTLTPETRAWVEQAAYRAALAVPLLVKGSVVGALGVGDREDRVFRSDEIRLVEAFASHAAIALENARLYGELREALENVEASQKHIVETERLRALGELAGGVAHNFNNALAIILGRAELLLERTRNIEVRRQLQVIEQTARDAARTVKRIEEFTRTRRGRPFQPVELSQLVEEVVELTRPRWKEAAQAGGIAYDVLAEKATAPRVVGDPSELREALTSLLFNALDAMPAGGRVTFRTGSEGGQAYCAVTDTGTGMSEEVKQRVFDPFFTTKGEKGSGLGLSVVYGIVARHGGTIDVQSQAGQGSTFTIRLPAGGGVVEVPGELPPPPPERTGRILVIDDEPELLDVLGELLAAQGHRVAACPDGESGLRRFQEEPFDLVITDLGMPGLTGWEVVERVKRLSPGTPVAVLTGWADRIAPEEARAKGADFLMGKPFTSEEIQTLLSHALPRH